MAYVNLIDIVYPVGSVYMSTSSAPPATLFGGSWNQVKGAVIGATGANGFANSASYDGALKLRSNQLPQHAHVLRYNITHADVDKWSNDPMKDIDELGGFTADLADIANVLCTFNATAHGGFSVTDGTIYYHPGGTSSNWVNIIYAAQLLNGGGQNFLPYHFGVYCWVRTK